MIISLLSGDYLPTPHIEPSIPFAELSVGHVLHQLLREVCDHWRDGAGGGGARGSAPRRHPLPGLQRQEDDGR